MLYYIHQVKQLIQQCREKKMGQYYKYVNLDKNEYITSWDYNNGAKLMESCYIKNNFQTAFKNLLSTSWNGDNIIYCGDYAWEDGYAPLIKDKFGLEEDPYDMAHANDINDDRYDSDNNWHAVKADEVEKLVNEYGLSEYPRYALNHTKKQYIDQTTGPVSWVWFDKNDKPSDYVYTKDDISVARYDELPLLLAVGNGLGGGDYCGPNENMIGYWAGDDIELCDEVPNGYEILFPVFDELGIFVEASDEDIIEYCLENKLMDKHYCLDTKEKLLDLRDGIAKIA